MSVCNLCKNNLAVKFDNLFDDRYGYPGMYKMWKCDVCRHLSLEAQFTPGMLGELYSKYYPRKHLDIKNWQPHKPVKGFMTWFNGKNSSAFRWVPENVRILDIGCGFGETLGYHQNRACEVYGVEADENIKRVVEKFGFKVHVGLFDVNQYETDFFDYITMDQVIEHVSDPAATLNDIKSILKPGGVAILSTPYASSWGIKFFGRKWEHWHIPYHLHIFSKRSMRKYAEAAGLELERAITITNSEWLYFQWIHLITYPKPEVPSVFWTPNRDRSFMQKVAIKLIHILHKLKVNHLITRFFDVLNIGDNSIYFLRKPLK